MATRRSQNGWPVIDRTDADDALRVWTIPGQQRNIQIPLLPAAPGFVLAHWALTVDREIEDLEASIGDEHGYSERPIAGTTEWSNHASATAVDLNSAAHPQGKTGTWMDPSPPRGRSADWKYERMDDLLAGKYRGIIRAGYTFRTTVDDMHFELVAGRILVRELAESLFDTNRGEKLREANPWLRWTP